MERSVLESSKPAWDIPRYIKKSPSRVFIVVCAVILTVGYFAVRRHRSRQELLHQSQTSKFEFQTSGLSHGAVPAQRGLRTGIKLYDWNPQTEREIKHHRIKTLFLLFYDSQNASIINPAMSTLASQFSRREILHVKVVKEQIPDFLFFLPDDPESFVPFATIVLVDQGFRKYRYPASAKESIPISANDHSLSEQLIDFEDKFWKGGVQNSLWLRSEEASVIDSDSRLIVHHLVGSQFNERVMHSKKDVVVLFYAPWCGHCKRFDSKFHILAQKFMNVKSIAFLKIDVTKNDVDHPDVAIHRVPYVRLFRAYDKAHPVKFDHARQDVLEYGTDFLEKNAQISFDLKRSNGEVIGSEL